MAEGFAYDLADRGVIGVGAVLNGVPQVRVEPHRDDLSRRRADQRSATARSKAFGRTTRLGLVGQSLDLASVGTFPAFFVRRLRSSGIGVTSGE